MAALLVTTLGTGLGIFAAEPQAQPAQAPASSDAKAAPPPSSTQEAVATSSDQASKQPSLPVQSPLVRAVVRMTDAGVSSDVIQTYVACSPSIEPPTDADIIVMKEHKVPDEIVSALMKQTSERRAQKIEQAKAAAEQALADRRARFGGLDPESYDYFQYYYLQPRAMASAYRRLYPYAGPRVSFIYGPTPRSGYPRFGHFGPYR